MSAMPADGPASGPAMSLAQQRDALWADPAVRVYAVMVTSSVPGLRQRLAGGDVDDWDILWTGQLEAEERAAAPVLVTLRKAGPFTDWLLGDVAAAVPGWGALAASRLPFLGARLHGRGLCKAQLPNGQAIRVDWMDPEVLQPLLSLAGGDQLRRVFGGFETLVTTGPDRWTRWSLDASRLRRDVTAIA